MRFPWPTLLCALLLGVGCTGGGTADTDADTDTDIADTDTDTDTVLDTDTGTLDTDTETADTGTPDTGTPDPYLRDGVYVGALDFDVEASGTSVLYDSCVDAAFTVTVDTSQTPQITGASISCALTGDLAGQTIEVELSGDIIGDPYVLGDAGVTLTPVGPQSDTWEGLFTGPDTLSGTFEGVSIQGDTDYEWTGTFIVQR